jgi:hypothetical protein
MFEIKIIDIKSNQQTHGASFATEQEAQDWISLIESKLPCPWGKLERTIPFDQATEEELQDALEIIEEIYEEDILISPKLVRLPKTFQITTEDKTQQLNVENLITQGQENERKCKRALAFIGGYNDSRNLTTTQINTMQATFGTVFQMLLANRPNTAKQLITEIEVDGTLITEELKTTVLSLL